MNALKIKSIKSLGYKTTYNLSMESEQHNYEILDPDTSTCIITRNSHAAAYGFLSYEVCYLKANFPDEFAVAFLNTFMRRAMGKSASEWDTVTMMENDAKNTLNIKFLNRDVNKCGMEYQIVRKRNAPCKIYNTEVRPAVCCKGLGFETARSIVENQPYEDLDDFAVKTDGGVSSDAIIALYENGFLKTILNKKYNSKEAIVERINLVRKEKRDNRRRGLGDSDEIF